MDPERFQHLLDRHFDDLLDEAGRAELERALAGSPERARDFVRAARFDGAIERHFGRRAAEAAAAAAARRAMEEVAAAPPARVPTPRPARAWPAFAGWWREHGWGTAIAVGVHAVLIALLLRVVVFRRPEPPQGTTVALAPRDEARFDEFRRDLPPWPSNAKDPLIAVPSVAPEAALAPLPGVTPGAGDGVARGLRAPPLPGIGVPAAFAARSAAERRRVLDRWAGADAPAIDAALVRAAAWLRLRQGADGSWPPSAGASDPAATALAVLAFLAGGDPPFPAADRMAVETGLAHLVSLQGADGRFRAGDPAVQALGTCALAEAYGLMRLPHLRDPLDRALQALAAAQQPDGSWTPPGRGVEPIDDALRTAWNAQALRAASAAGLAEGPPLPLVRARAIAHLKSRQNPASGFFYSRPGAPLRESPEFPLTAAAVSALTALGEGRSPEARFGLGSLRRAGGGAARPGDARPGETDFFLAQAWAGGGEERAERLYRGLAREILARQASDGHWAAGGGESNAYGDAGVTALRALALLAPCRYAADADAAAALAARFQPLELRPAAPGPPLIRARGSGG
jgi:hypothetical protein